MKADGTANGRVRPSLVVAGVAALATAAAVTWDLGRPSYWLDEAATVGVARRSVGQILATLGNLDAVHGAYYLLMHFWIGLLGASEFAARLPSAVAMVVCAFGVARIGQRLVGVRVGLFAGLLFALQPAVSLYAVEARSEALVAAFAVWSTWFLLDGLERPRSAVWIKYALCVLCMGLLHMFSILLVVAHCVTVALDRGLLTQHNVLRDGVVRAWGLATAGAGVACAPVVLIALGQKDQVGWIPPITGWRLLDLADLWAGDRMLVPIAIPLVVTGIVLAAPKARRLGVPWLVVPPAGLLLLSAASPVFLTRYLVYTIPACSLLVAIALDRLLGRRAISAAVAVAAIALLVLVGVPRIAYEHTTASKFDDLRGEARFLTTHAAPGEGLVFMTSTSRWASLAYPRGTQGLVDLTQAAGGSPVEAANLRGIDASAREIASRLESYRRVWVVSDNLRDIGADVAMRRQMLAAAGFVVTGEGFESHGRTIVLVTR